VEKQVAIIGGGPAGLSAAYSLIKEGWNPTIFEASSYVGGMSRSFELWGHPVDFGPHRFFSKSPEVLSLWKEILGRDILTIKRKTRIYFDGKYIDYPLSFTNVCKRLGVFESIRCVLSYLSSRNKDFKTKNINLQEWLVFNFGKRLYKHFFEEYNKKLWGVSCDHIAADFASQRIRGLSLPEAVKSAIGMKSRAKRTLSDSFEYPNSGSGLLYNRMALRIMEAGGVIQLDSKINKIEHLENENKIVVTAKNGFSKKFDHLISTMPLSSLVNCLKDTPEEVIEAASNLQYRNTIIAYLKVEADALFDDQWIYVHDYKVNCGRITNFRNWLNSDYKEGEGTILCCEYWCSDNDQLWLSDDDSIIKMASDDIKQTGLIGNSRISNGHVEKVRRSYPMYLKGYKENLLKISKWLNSFDKITAIGRSGAHMYNNQDHSILMGILSSQNICKGADHNLWDFNKDNKYQES
jgi:protoporphyrinogen oxidase